MSPSRLIAVRPGEGRLVVLVAGAFAAVETGRGLGEVGVDTLVLSRQGPDVLPALYIGLGVTSLVITLAYGAALTRSSSERFFSGLLLVLAAVLAAEWLITLSGATAAVPLAWVTVYAAGLLLMTAMWTVGGLVFDVRQAKRLFPLLTSAAIAGSLAGFLGAIVVQRVAGAESLILVQASLLIGAAGLLMRLGTRVRPQRGRGERTPSIATALTAGAAYVAASPLMRLLAFSYVLLAILMFSLMFPFMTAMTEAFPEEDQLLTALALFSTGVTVVSFLGGILLTSRLNARFGVASVALALPVVYVLGFAIWIVRFTLVTAVTVRFAQQVTQRGASNAAFSAFYSVVPAQRRGQVLAFMDGVPGQFGTIISGVLLMVASSLALEQVFQMGLITAVVCVAVLFLVRRAYARGLVATLRAGHAEQVLEGGPGLAALARDRRVLDELRAATSDERPEGRLLAADLLGRLEAHAASSELSRLCGDPDPRVRLAALTALARIAGGTASPQLAEALGDADAQVRRAALRALCSVGQVGTIDPAVLAVLDHDEDAWVRGEVAAAIAASGDRDGARSRLDGMLRSPLPVERQVGLEVIARIVVPIDTRAVLELLDDPSPEVRSAALRAAAAHAQGDLATYLRAFDDVSCAVRRTAGSIVAARSDSADDLLAIVRHGTDRAAETALLALAGQPDTTRDELVSWAVEKVQVAAELRRHRTALGSAEPTSSAGYLGRIIAQREASIEARLLQVLSVLGAPEANGLIRRCLRAPDPEVRAQAIEALGALGEPRLARSVVSLLDPESSAVDGGPGDIIVAANALSSDSDPWVRALALRTLSEHLRAEQRSLAQRAMGDSDPRVRAAVEIEEAVMKMPSPPQLVSHVDRMLALRRVPIFEVLDPEDLQRVAAAALERSWADGDELMTEGDLGDELIVIVEGHVSVVRQGGDRARPLRTYGPGDHIGELAVLRSAPRAASVIAGAAGVRGLVINGEVVQALLHERPDAAMAMLATLAERISQQT